MLIKKDEFDYLLADMEMAKYEVIDETIKLHNQKIENINGIPKVKHYSIQEIQDKLHQLNSSLILYHNTKRSCFGNIFRI